jgi:lipopolysaccharide transport system ATP-binding protein
LDETVIRVENVTLRFNMASEKTDNLKEYFIKLVKGQLRFEEFLVLKNIDFEVKRGESWGIVGSNGAGKSTFLKLICGILVPDTGSVAINGVIAPLIELGAGFDFDLTAEENVYLNGALLGHNRKFMQEKYDDIVDFAELKDFMGMPIKNFSLGMQIRLGFAIATLLKPDILILDEILAVGDAAFQKKSERRINEMLNGETALLFVSHNKEIVKRMCKKAVWLKKGEVVMMGDAAEVCDAYEQDRYVVKE